jgi:hypothetical protein
MLRVSRRRRIEKWRAMVRIAIQVVHEVIVTVSLGIF